MQKKKSWFRSFKPPLKGPFYSSWCAGSQMNVGPIVYEPPRNGPTLWEIGVPDRTAGEFYIPDPYPTLMNKLYVNPLQDRLVP